MGTIRLTIPSPNPNSGLGPITLTNKLDINHYVPRDACPDLNQDYHAQWDRLVAERKAITGNSDDMLAGPLEAEFLALEALIGCVPTSLPGIVALIGYLKGFTEGDDIRIEDAHFPTLFASLSEALNGLSAA